MAKLVVLYPPPTDATEFDKAYQNEHLPLMQDKLKGRKVAVTSVKAAAIGESPYYLMAEIWAPSIEDLQGFLSTPDGQAVSSNAFKISTGGPPAVLFTEEEVHQL
jgi:uncharacterized protein (TIGR02118 family)